MISLTVFVSLLFFYSLISQRLDRTIVTAPIVFHGDAAVSWLAGDP